MLWVYYILLSGFILYFFSRICWNIRINIFGGLVWDLVRKYVDLVGKYVVGVRYKS